MKHPHHDIIIAFLEGREIEREMSPGCWESVFPWKNWSDCTISPCFSTSYRYRIKPTPKYRVVFRTSSGMLLVSTGYFESLSAFESIPPSLRQEGTAIELIQATRKEE